jgi:pyruvate,water dikinase
MIVMNTAAGIPDDTETSFANNTIVRINNGSSSRRNERMSSLSPVTGLPMVCWLEECRKESVELVGGKCSSLGELINAGVRVPPGFALTTEGYRRFMADAGIDREVQSLLVGLDAQDMDALENTSMAIRELIEAQSFSTEIEDLVAENYRKLSVRSCVPAVPVAVRSSATAEDLPGASFAGQQDTYLWIRGIDEVLHNMRRCISSLYTGRAIAYRINQGYGDELVAISVGVQKMANSFTAGVMFTLHPANGDRSVIVIDSNYGFGESVVSGEVTPDNFVVNKITLDIIERTISQKDIYYTVDQKSQESRKIEVPFERQKVQSLVDDEITELAWMGKQIEKHYGRPMDIEWAVDKDLPFGGNIFILQARPETVWSQKHQTIAKPGTTAMDYILSSMLEGKRLT